jgi:hypothetical protein
MKINLELSSEELSKFNQSTLENHIIAHADKIAKSVFKDNLSKGLRGGEIQLIDDLSAKMVDLYEQRLKTLSKNIIKQSTKD